MNERTYECAEHKAPRIPDGQYRAINLDPTKRCRECAVLAEFVVLDKPLNYPRLNTA